MNKFTKIVEDVKNTPTATDIILSKWNEYSNKSDKYEFYHKMREDGYDGITIIEIMNNEWTKPVDNNIPIDPNVEDYDFDTTEL